MGDEIGTRTFLYALDEEYNIQRYVYIKRIWLSIPELKARAIELQSECPGTIGVYAVENSFDLYEQCKCVMKKRSVEDRVIFKSLLETEGIKII